MILQTAGNVLSASGAAMRGWEQSIQAERWQKIRKKRLSLLSAVMKRDSVSRYGKITGTILPWKSLRRPAEIWGGFRRTAVSAGSVMKIWNCLHILENLRRLGFVRKFILIWFHRQYIYNPDCGNSGWFRVLSGTDDMICGCRHRAR